MVDQERLSGSGQDVEARASRDGKLSLTPEQQAEAAAKKAARAQVKAKGKKGSPAPVVREVSQVRVNRDQPSRLRERYTREIRARLCEELGLKNPMEVPKLTKIIINMGLGEAVTNPKILDSAMDSLAAITGQRPVITKARKSIATFKLRLGQKIGCMVTLRRDHMYEFLDRLVSFALPRVRDFKGVSQKSFDGRGNYTLGIREDLIFPEINYERIEKPKGMNITIATSAQTDEHGRALLRQLGIPFRS